MHANIALSGKYAKRREGADDMGNINWTDAQKRAIEGRGNILVSAAAGSGKTAALTAKILSLLSHENCNLGDFLIVTFTKAAAGEMRERISRSLSEAVLTDRSMSRHIRDIASADICTIHSFCTKLLRENFAVLGISPSFSVCDEADADVMKSRAMESTVDDLFAGRCRIENGADIFTLADTFGRTRDVSRFDAELRELYDKLVSMGLDESFPKKCAERLEAAATREFFDSPWGEVIRDRISSAARHYLNELKVLMPEMAESKDVTEKYMPTARALCDYLERVLSPSAMRSYSEMQRAFLGYEKVGLGKLSAKQSTDAAVRFKELRDEIKKQFTELLNRYFASSVEDISLSMTRLASVLRGASELLTIYAERYCALKRERSCLDFADLETEAYRLLVGEDGSPTQIAREVAAGYKFVFIDEYQDTNRLQDSIFGAVSTQAEKFFVGDIKQSIYRFRGAEPEVFSGYREAWNECGDGEIDCEGRSIFMSDNFRCAEPIVEFVNAVSRRMFPYGGIPFEEADCLVYGGVSQNRMPVEVCLLDGSRKKNSDDDSESISEADYVAERICELLRSGEYRPSDIAILLRSANVKGDEYVKSLSERGVPAQVTGGSPFAEEREVILMLDILRTVDNPMRDIPLAGAMLSSVFGFSLDELVGIRESGTECPLYTSVIKASEGDGPLAGKCRTFIDKISALRNAERGMSADRFIDRVISDCSLFDCAEVVASPCGADNIRRIRDLAVTYESGTFGGLYGFLAFIDEKLASNELTAESAEGQSGVCVISIHKSKGLEFPVCFLSECGARRNAADERAGIMLHRELGLAARLPDEGGLVMCGNPVRDALGLRLGEDNAKEEMRVLYVAMTRAVERLFITAKCSSSPQREIERAENKILFADEYSVVTAPRMIDHILAAVVAEPTLPVKLCAVMRDDTTGEMTVMSLSDENEECETAPVDIDAVAKSLAFSYPYEHMTTLPSKLAVSSLYPNVLDENDIPAATLSDVFVEETRENDVEKDKKMPLPRFMSESTDNTAAERGTSNHVFLQFASFSALRSDGVEAELVRLLSNGFITEKMASYVEKRQIEHFAESKIIDRILSARRVFRELRFNLTLDASLFTLSAQQRELYSRDGAEITVQGVFDCLFEDADGKLVLLDYKTDSLTPYELHHREAAHKKLRAKHARQLYYYILAASKIFERTVDEAYIYSLTLGECIDMKDVEPM